MSVIDPSDEEQFFEEVTGGVLRYHIFDWDNNILHMPTKIILEKRGKGDVWERVEVSTSTFALIRSDTENYRPPGPDWESAFVNFRDLHERGESAFLTDTRAALQRVIDGEIEIAPSFDVFRRTLIEGRLFGIVTARGHKPESIRAGVEYFIDEVLSPEERDEMLRNLRAYIAAYGEETEPPRTDDQVRDYYLSLNKYHGVTSPDFIRGVLAKEGTGAESPEAAKQLAIRDIVEHILSIVRSGPMTRPVSIGFSDDDLGNVEAVQDYIETRLATEFPDVSFAVFDTSDPEVPFGRKIVLRGQLELGLE